jgi:hypothetical protein
MSSSRAKGLKTKIESGMNYADKLPMCVRFFAGRCFPGHSNTTHCQATTTRATLTAPLPQLGALGEGVWSTQLPAALPQEIFLLPHCEPRYCSRYNAAVQAARSGNRIPVVAEFSHPAFSTVCTGSVYQAGVNRPGCGVNYPPAPCAEIKERVELHPLIPIWALMAGYKWNFTLFTH